jgi:hypothetical protein
MLQQPDHLHFLAERRYKKSPAFWARDYSWKRVYSAFSSTGVVEVKGEVNAASEPPETPISLSKESISGACVR